MKDILLNEASELDIRNGDFVVGASEQQHVEAIFLTQKGEYKEFPLLGFGAENYLKSTVSQVQFKRDLKIQLAYDFFGDAKIDLSNGFKNLTIEIPK